MKTFISTITLISIFTLTFAQGDKYPVDNNKSTISWHAEKVTGSHEGYVGLKKGEIILKNDHLIGGSFEIDMTSLTCSDIEDQKWNAKLVGHLKSDDFFSVEKNPTAKLVITNVLNEGNNRYNVTGKMTIKNITKEVSFIAFLNNNNGVLTIDADITIDRTEFDVRYNSKNFFDGLGDKVIYDDFDLKIKLVTNTKNKKA